MVTRKAAMQVFSKHTTDSAPGTGKMGGNYQPLKGPGTRVLPITVDKQGRERIGFVKKTAFSQYLLFHKDPHFIQSLPDFNLPMLGAGSFRAFEVPDDSMYPLEAGTIVVGEYVQDWENFSSGKTYIVVHEEFGVIYRRMFKNSHISDLKLVAEKKTYPNIYVDLNKVHEIWEARMFMSI